MPDPTRASLEAQDLATLKSACDRERDLAFMMFRDILRMNTIQLATIGHKTIESALRSTIEHTLSDIKKLQDAHIRQYPD